MPSSGTVSPILFVHMNFWKLQEFTKFIMNQDAWAEEETFSCQDVQMMIQISMVYMCVYSHPWFNMFVESLRQKTEINIASVIKSSSLLACEEVQEATHKSRKS